MYLFTPFGEETEFKVYGVEGTRKNYSPSFLQNKMRNFLKNKWRT